jgi:hypothetical protein
MLKYQRLCTELRARRGGLMGLRARTLSSEQVGSIKSGRDVEESTEPFCITAASAEDERR